MSDEQPPISHARPYADFALAGDAKSLDPAHAVNKQLVDVRKMGQVPRVLHVDEEHRWAIVALPAVSATLKVPLGWHLLDDGDRSLMFDSGGQVQIHFSLLDANGRTVDAMIDDAKASILNDHPKLQTLTQSLGGMRLLAIADLPADDSKVDICFLISESPVGEGLYLQARITADSEKMTEMMDLFELLMTGFQFLIVPE